MRRALLLLLVLPWTPLLAKEPDPDAGFAEALREYREIRKSADWEDIKKRRDLINELGEMDHPGAEKVLYEAFTEDREQVCRIPAMVGLGKRGSFARLKAMVTAAVRDRNDVYVMCLPLAFAFVTDEKIGPWLVKHLLTGQKSPELRAAVIESLGLLRTPGAFEPIAALLEKERRDARITYECLLALARIDGARAVESILPFLEHENRVLREGAVSALGETGEAAVLEHVLLLAGDEGPRVQEAVAGVILGLKAEAALPVLIDLLRTGRLRVMDTARNALEGITGERLGLDADAWEHWLETKAAGTAPAVDPNEPPSSVARYYGMSILSDRLLFVLDVSGSMTAGSPERIQTAREELAKTLGQLNQKTLFNVVAFSGSPIWWRDEEVPATEENLKDALGFVNGLSAGGGTNIYDTFEQAFEKNRRIDTVFFLGDGSPSLGKHTEQEEILARIRWMNRFRKVRIHTIALIRGEVGRFGGRMGPGLGRGRSASGARAYDEEEAARFMARLAAENGGSFLKIDK